MKVITVFFSLSVINHQIRIQHTLDHGIKFHTYQGFIQVLHESHKVIKSKVIKSSIPIAYISSKLANCWLFVLH